MSYETIYYQVEDHIATITLDRSQVLNACTVTMVNELIAVLDQKDSDGNFRAVVITEAGRAFCLGADLSLGEKSFDYESQGHGALTKDGHIDWG